MPTLQLNYNNTAKKCSGITVNFIIKTDFPHLNPFQTNIPLNYPKSTPETFAFLMFQ